MPGHATRWPGCIKRNIQNQYQTAHRKNTRQRKEKEKLERDAEREVEEDDDDEDLVVKHFDQALYKISNIDIDDTVGAMYDAPYYGRVIGKTDSEIKVSINI